MKEYYFYILLLCFCIASGCTEQKSQSNDQIIAEAQAFMEAYAKDPRAKDAKDIAAINELREKELEAARAGNVDALMALRTDDFIAMLPGMPAIKGKEALSEVLSGMFGQMEEFEHNTVSEEIIVSGDWAFHRGTYTDRVTLKSGGETVAYEGKYLWILKRQEDGSWKYAIQMSNKNGSASE